MLNTNTQTQADKEKSMQIDAVPTSDSVISEVKNSSSLLQTGSSDGKYNNSLKDKLFSRSKSLLAAGGIILFLIVAALGVFIAQRQTTGPVAPNAPGSQPSAQEISSDSCTVAFDVVGVSETPTPSPTPKPTPTLECETGQWATDLGLIAEDGKVETDDGKPYFDPNGKTFTVQVPSNKVAVGIACYDCDHYSEESGKGWIISWNTDSFEAITDNNTWGFWPVSINGENVITFDGGGDSHGGNVCLEDIPEVTPTPTPVITPTPEPTQTPLPNICGYKGCNDDSDCDSSLVCVDASDGNSYCAEPDYANACKTKHTETACCTAPTPTPSPSPTPTPTPTPTPAPQACGSANCKKDSDCEGSLVCVNADNDNSYCAEPDYANACKTKHTETACCTAPTPTPSPSPTPTPTPTPTPAPQACGSQGCTSNNDCSGSLICVGANDGHSYCSEPNYTDACSLNYSYTSCCVAPTPTPVPTNPPVQIVQVGCNSVCVSNADCVNSSHICFTADDGASRCRLATNVSSTTCSQPTTTVVAQQPPTVIQQVQPVQQAQPVLPAQLPQTGPEDWMNWVKGGVLTLGVGALLLLLL